MRDVIIGRPLNRFFNETYVDDKNAIICFLEYSFTNDNNDVVISICRYKDVVKGGNKCEHMDDDETIATTINVVETSQFHFSI